MRLSDFTRSLRALSRPGLTTGLAVAVLLSAACNSSTELDIGPLSYITLVPTAPSLAINGTQQFFPFGHDASGNPVAITPTWSVVAGGGSISSAGLFTAGTTAGTFTNTVQATSGTISATVTVTVTAGPLATITVSPNPASLVINATQQFTAVGRDTGNNVVAITPVWSVAAGGGTVSTAGLFTAGTTAGTFANTVRATSGTVSGTSTVTVTVGALATITVAPNPASLVINATQQFTAVGRDSGNNVVAITPTWSVAAGGGTVSTAGLFTAGTTAGTFANTVRATSGTVSDNATVTVTAGSLATITVTPNPHTLAINGTQQFTAVGRDASSNVVVITPVWSVVASGGAINGTGLFTAGTTPGTFTNTVQATSGTVSGTATVDVTVGALATITVTPNPASLASNATQQFTAVGRDAGSNVVVITPVWAVVASGGSINGTGLFTAGAVDGTFTNTVQASSGAISGTATVNVSTPSSLAPVDLGAAGNYVILAKSAISNVPTSAITGDLGLSPAAASFITGFALNLPAAGASSTSSQVTGAVFASDYAPPTPANLTTAVSNMEAAYTDAAGRTTPDFTEHGAGEIGGLTLVPGLYKWGTAVLISTDVTLQGSATDVWIFQIAGALTQASATRVNLTGGALAQNVFWQVAGAVSIGTTAHMEGVILSETAINLATGASANGRLLAQTSVNLAGNAVVEP